MVNRIELNTPAPNFTLTDFKGNEISLSDFKEKKKVLLVFNRGFAWPFCQKHMAQLRHDYGKFTAQNTEVIVVGPETAANFSEYWQKHDLPFIGLPNPKHTVLKLYGQEVNLFKLGRIPAQVIIDKKGIARFAHYGHNMSDIASNEDILDLLKTLDEEVSDAGQQ